MDNFNIYPNTRLGKLVKAKKLEDILELCDDFCPGEPPEYFFDRLEAVSYWHHGVTSAVLLNKMLDFH